MTIMVRETPNCVEFVTLDAPTRRAELLVLLADAYKALRDQELPKEVAMDFAMFKDIMDMADYRTFLVVLAKVEDNLNPFCDNRLADIYLVYVEHAKLCQEEARTGVWNKMMQQKQELVAPTLKQKSLQPPQTDRINPAQVATLIEGLSGYFALDDVRPKIDVDLIDDILGAFDREDLWIDSMDLSTQLVGGELDIAIELIKQAVTDVHLSQDEVNKTIWCQLAKRDLPAVAYFDQFGDAEDENYALAP